jgi:hypothetical protein
MAWHISEPPGLLKGELLKLLSTIPLRHLSCLTVCSKVTLGEGDLSDKAFSIIASRG